MTTTFFFKDNRYQAATYPFDWPLIPFEPFALRDFWRCSSVVNNKLMLPVAEYLKGRCLYREDICLQTLLLLLKYANPNHKNKRSFVSTANEAPVGTLMTIGDFNNIFPIFCMLQMHKRGVKYSPCSIFLNQLFLFHFLVM